VNWSGLSMPYRRRLFTLVRRDLQRLELLEKGHPVPPTPLLDRDWQNVDDPIGWVLRWLPEVSDLSEREKMRFARYSAELFSVQFPAWEGQVSRHPETRF